jgi:hypothetical protein
VIVNIDKNRQEDVEAIRAFVPHVIVTHPLAPTDNLALYCLLGAIFHRREHAQRLCAAFEGELRKTLDFAAELRKTPDFAAELPYLRVLYLIWRRRPWMTISRETYISRTLALGWLTLQEKSEKRYPEVDLKGGGHTRGRTGPLLQRALSFEAHHLDELRAITGFSRRRVILIDGTMTGWYGSRAIEGLGYLQNLAWELTRVPG